jgi:hypothetical protein
MPKYKLICEKHGDITDSVMYFDYEIVDPIEGEIRKVHDFYCIECINNVLKDLQKNGKIGKVTAKPIE